MPIYSKHPSQPNKPDCAGIVEGDCTASEPVTDIQHRWGVSKTSHLAIRRIGLGAQILDIKEKWVWGTVQVS